MSDFSDFSDQFQRLADKDWPIILVDFLGRGRSSNRAGPADYSTPNDARDVASVAAALGIKHAVFLGQGHGGQVVMALGASHSALIAGSILIDASPITDTPGLVRMRDSLYLMGKVRGKQQFSRVAHQVYGNIYPGASAEELNALAARTHEVEKNGRVTSFFDQALLKRLEQVRVEDMFEAQWPLFNVLANAPMMLLRTQLTDQLQRATFERMASLRSDAVQLIIPGQGSPALLSGEDEVGAIVDFVRFVSHGMKASSIVAG